MIHFLLFVSLFASQASLAQSKEEMCATSKATTLSEYSVPGAPNWFFKVLSDTQALTYASNGSNYLYDLKEKKLTQVPGFVDAVPLMDESVVTITGYSGPKKKSGLEFYWTEDLKKLGKNAKPLKVDTKNMGSYQSAGLVKTNADGSSVHRMLTQRVNGDGSAPARLQINDYILTPGEEGRPPKIVETGKIVKLCPGRDLKLPMLRKDNGANELSAFDIHANVSKIFHFDDKTGACTEIASLGRPAAKADFSFDGKSLIYHAPEDGNILGRNSEAKTPSDDWKLNLWVFHRDSGVSEQVTHHQNANAYHPVFRKDGSIIYALSNSKNHQHSFVAADISGKPIPALRDANCHPNARVGLWALWKNICASPDVVNSDQAEMIALSLRPDVCEKMVRNYWTQNSSKMMQTSYVDSRNGGSTTLARTAADLNQDHLLAACPKAVAVPQGGAAAPTTMTAQSIYNRKCIFCHMEGPHKFDFNNLAALKTKKSASNPNMTFANSIKGHINGTLSPRMPMDGGALEANEIAAIEKALR